MVPSATAADVALRLVGIKETPGAKATPLVLAMLQLDNSWVSDDATAWCAAFVGFLCWLLGLPRTKSLSARSWLTIGDAIDIEDAKAGYDVVILTRGKGPQPGPDVLAASGHVGFYLSHNDTHVVLVSGNMGDKVTVDKFPLTSLLGVRRLA
jgi:uncharacterized protein (TIGR02594 family)